MFPGAVKEVRERHRDLPPEMLAGLLGGNALRFYGPRLEALVRQEA